MSAASAVPAFTLSEAEFAAFRAFFYHRTGIAFVPSHRHHAARRLAQRLAATGAPGFTAYLEALRGPAGEAELERLINLLTVNATYFFREEHQFDTLVETLLPEIIARRPPGARLRLLSLPCATGEEPYSIALYLLEHWPDLARYKVELLAGDIDTAALAAAREGVFSGHALKRLPPATLRRHFTALPGGRYRLNAALREAVQFSHVNVTSARQMRRYADIDVLFCRNMLIYFDDASRRAAISHFHAAVSPGGFICLGHSETMGALSSQFIARGIGRGVIYQRPQDTP